MKKPTEKEYIALTCPPKSGPEFMLGFGQKTLEVFYGPLHPPQMPEML